ncbi:MAG: hypothetical protein AMJ46_14070 [Latescibacteria bacterium DG_63]|nr:MAG: hypothetical protein AMJ46_14070 [Latescibacteria bacterium DG_63]
MLALSDGALKRGRVIQLLDLSRSAFERHSIKLTKYGLIRRAKHAYYTLTSQGRDYVEQLSASTTPHLAKELDRRIMLLPTMPHQAFFRLLLSGILAKTHLLRYYEDGWPSFIAYGRTATLKTTIATLACKVFGLEPARQIYLVTSALPKELGIRRVRQKGKRDFDIQSSSYFEEPFVCFDELDKASNEVKKKALTYGDGRRESFPEGKRVVNKACVMLALNKLTGNQEIWEPYIRRGVVLNTDPLLADLSQCDQIARQILKKPIPGLSLGHAVVRQTELSDAEHALLRGLLEAAVRPEDWGVKVDTRPVAILVLGRLLLTGGSDVREAVYATAYDRLWCLETIGGTVEGWQKAFREKWARYRGERRPELEREAAALKQKEEERAKRLEERRAVIRAQTAAKVQRELEFVGLQEELVQRLLYEKTIPPFGLRSGDWVPRTKPAKKMMDDVVSRIRKVKVGDFPSLESLEAIAAKLIDEKLRPIFDEYDAELAAQRNQREAQQKRAEETRSREMEQREIEQLEREMKNPDPARELTFEDKELIKRIDEYLRRKMVRKGENIASVLQSLGILERKSVADIERERQEAEREAKIPSSAGTPVLKAQTRLFRLIMIKLDMGTPTSASGQVPDHVLIGIDDRPYLINHFTDWQKARALLLLKRRQILNSASERYIRKRGQRLQELRWSRLWSYLAQSSILGKNLNKRGLAAGARDVL